MDKTVKRRLILAAMAVVIGVGIGVGLSQTRQSRDQAEALETFAKMRAGAGEIAFVILAPNEPSPLGAQTVVLREDASGKLTGAAGAGPKNVAVFQPSGQGRVADSVGLMMAWASDFPALKTIYIERPPTPPAKPEEGKS